MPLMVNKQKSDLRSAFILLKCSKQKHNDCRQIRNALIDQIGNVQQAYTTDAELGGEKWCVAASALVDVNKKDEFKKKLWKLAAKGPKPIKITNLELLIDNQ